MLRWCVCWVGIFVHASVSVLRAAGVLGSVPAGSRDDNIVHCASDTLSHIRALSPACGNLTKQGRGIACMPCRGFLIARLRSVESVDRGNGERHSKFDSDLLICVGVRMSTITCTECSELHCWKHVIDAVPLPPLPLEPHKVSSHNQCMLRCP